MTEEAITNHISSGAPVYISDGRYQGEHGYVVEVESGMVVVARTASTADKAEVRVTPRNIGCPRCNQGLGISLAAIA